MAWGGGCAPSPENFSTFKIKMACFDALWDTVFKLMCLQRKALQQTPMQCSRRRAETKNELGSKGRGAEGVSVSEDGYGVSLSTFDYRRSGEVS